MTRQTLSYVRRRLEGAGIRPDTRKGQNFLVDLNLIDFLVRAARLTDRDVVLEVGTGTGSLTTRLADVAAHVVTVELDARLFELSGGILSERTNVTRMHGDVLQNKNRLASDVLEAVNGVLEAGRRFKLVANLPYGVATPVISNLLVGPLVPQRMVVTVQKEVADRMAARPGTKDYGALSVWVQSLCRVDVLRVLPPSVFWPRPKVDSAIVEIEPVPAKRAAIGDVTFFHQFVRRIFWHRRKYLRSVMLGAYKGQLDKRAVDAILGERGLAPDARAEQLDLDAMRELCQTIAERLS